MIPAICIFEKPSHGTISIIKNERHEIRNNIYPIVLTIDHSLSNIRITKIRIIGLILPQISGVSEQLKHQASAIRRQAMSGKVRGPGSEVRGRKRPQDNVKA